MQFEVSSIFIIFDSFQTNFILFFRNEILNEIWKEWKKKILT